jgi:AcrR family transcriptional regulator
MGRWEPDARGRLMRAAVELYGERGFEQVTVAEIAARAGLTERTFFRHFADKREILFDGQDAFRDLFVDAIAAAPAQAAPLAAVAAGLVAAGDAFEGRREHALRRQAVIASHPGLQERELIKLASLASALAEALRRRRVPEPAASLTAEAGVAVFKVAFARWVGDQDGEPSGADRPSLTALVREALDDLRAVTADG